MRRPRRALLALVVLIAPAAPAAVDGVCDQLAQRLTRFNAEQCRQDGFGPAGVTSQQGRPLLTRDFPPRNLRAPRVLLLGAIHGDELSAASVVFQWVEQIKSDRFQHFYWRVLPVTNPDGLFAVPATRVNARGVDLNRNFPTPDWKARAQSYWKAKTRSDPRRFPGPSEASEPETRWIVDEIRAFNPDAIVSVHAPYGLLDFDGPQEPPHKLGYLRLEPLGVYPGSLGNYAGVYLKLPVITLELPQAAQPPSAAQSGRIWADLLDWLEKNVKLRPTK